MNRTVTLALTLTAFVSCAAPDSLAPRRNEPASSSRAQSVGANLVECPTGAASSATALVTPLGGVVSTGGTSIAIPAGALAAAVNVTVTVPASQYMEVDISVAGSEHFLFEMPVVVTLSYARCTRSNIDQSPLTAWYIDSDTHELLAPMVGVDNKLARTVTFTTGHLSGYAVAN